MGQEVFTAPDLTPKTLSDLHSHFITEWARGFEML